MKLRLHCVRHTDKRAVAVINGRFPMCQKCIDKSTIEILNAGEGIILAFQGEPQALIIPQVEVGRRVQPQRASVN